MQNKKANLVIDIAKNVVEQYREQLKNSIEANKYITLDSYTYENHVIRAERALSSVDKILENFEQSIFDGEITEEAVYRAEYTSEGREMKELLLKKDVDKKDLELEYALDGTRRVFKQIGIPEYSIYPIVSDIMERTRESNYTNGELNEEKILCNIEFSDEDFALSFYEEQKMHYKKFNKEDYRLISEGNYVDKLKSYKKFVNYLCKNYVGISSDMEFIKEMIVNDYMHSTQTCIEEADNNFKKNIQDFIETDEQILSELLVLIKNIYKEYPKWIKRGRCCRNSTH